jgi:hypothetical protein
MDPSRAVRRSLAFHLERSFRSGSECNRRSALCPIDPSYSGRAGLACASVAE